MSYYFGAEGEFFRNPVPTSGSNPTTLPPEPIERQPTTTSAPDAPTEVPVPSSADGGGTQPAPSLTDQVTTLLNGVGTVDFNLKAGLIIGLATVLGVLGVFWLASK